MSVLQLTQLCVFCNLLYQNRQAAIESRRRKKVLVGSLTWIARSSSDALLDLQMMDGKALGAIVVVVVVASSEFYEHRKASGKVNR